MDDLCRPRAAVGANAPAKCEIVGASRDPRGRISRLKTRLRGRPRPPAASMITIYRPLLKYHLAVPAVGP